MSFDFWPYYLGMAIGAYIIWGATVKTDKMPYWWLHQKSEKLFKSKAHTFLSFAGGAVVGSMFFFMGLG